MPMATESGPPAAAGRARPLRSAPRADGTPHIVICGCGPGELMGWALPLMDAVSAARKPWIFSLLVWPRLLPSRRVAAVARESGRFLSVLDRVSALALTGGGQPPGAWRTRPPSLVLHLGGTANLSLRLGARLRCPVAAYVERPPPLPHRFVRIFSASAPDEVPGERGRAHADRVTPIGDLFVDALAPLREHRKRSAESDRPVVAFFPGSRSLQLRHYLPRIPAVATGVRRRLPEVLCLIARSPFVTSAMLHRGLDPSRAEGDAPHIVDTAEGPALVWAAEKPIPFVDREEALQRADLVVCTPGTTTAEAAALGIPMVLIAPFGEDFSIFSGLPGLVERAPGVGSVMKRLLLQRMASGMRYYAYPNIRAQKEIVPELQGTVDLDRIEKKIVELLENTRARNLMATQLLELMGAAGAAQRLMAGLESCLPPSSAEL